MIQATIYVQDHIYTGFHLLGHSDYGVEGDDIVCAAVSALVINTINAIESFTDDQIECSSDEESGEISFRFVDSPSGDASLLIKTMVLGLQNMEENKEYEPYIDIIFKED